VHSLEKLRIIFEAGNPPFGTILKQPLSSIPNKIVYAKFIQFGTPALLNAPDCLRQRVVAAQDGYPHRTVVIFISQLYNQLLKIIFGETKNIRLLFCAQVKMTKSRI
jgi:hypothetical protein